MRYVDWWQRRRDAAGFKKPIPGSKPLERWPDGWASLRIGHWYFYFAFCRYRKLPDFNPADYDNVP